MCCLLFQSSQDILWYQDAQTGGTDCEGAGEDSLPWSGVSDNTVIIIIACYVAVLALAGGFRSRHWFHASVPFLGLIAIWKVHSASWSSLTVRRDMRGYHPKKILHCSVCVPFQDIFAPTPREQISTASLYQTPVWIQWCLKASIRTGFTVILPLCLKSCMCRNETCWQLLLKWDRQWRLTQSKYVSAISTELLNLL